MKHNGASSVSTDCMYVIVHSARQKFVRRAWEKAQVNEKWAQSSWAKKIEARQKVNAVYFSGHFLSINVSECDEFAT